MNPDPHKHYVYFLRSQGDDSIMSAWQPIETAPKVEGEYLLGFDAESADAHGDPKAGVCVLLWMDPDEDFDGGWEVRPFSEGLDCIEETNITHWMPLPVHPKEGETQP